MTRRFWSFLVCLAVVALGVIGVVFNGDVYDTHSPIYAFVERITPKADFDHAESYSQLMRRQDVEGLKRESVPGMLSDDVFKELPRLASYFPQAEPTSIAPIQYTLSASSDGSRKALVAITHDYANGDVVVTTVAIDKTTNKVESYNINKLTAADRRMIWLNPLAANSTQAVVLGLAAMVVLFTLLTLYVCLSDKTVKWKWLWFIFILAGVGSLQFNWGTQILTTQLINVRWWAAGWFQNLFNYAVIYINFPLGAVVFWATRKRAKPASPVPLPEY